METPLGDTGVAKVRLPILNITVTPDLAEPNDIDLLQALFLGPLPAEIYVRPQDQYPSISSTILAECFDTIAFDEFGNLDTVRIRDFINSLFLLAGLSLSASVDSTGGKRISERAAILICELYTQQYSEISERIHHLQEARRVEPEPTPPIHRSITINDRLFSLAKVPIMTILESLVEIQYETIRRIPNVYDEL
jgi:hypothetical protein